MRAKQHPHPHSSLVHKASRTKPQGRSGKGLRPCSGRHTPPSTSPRPPALRRLLLIALVGSVWWALCPLAFAQKAGEIADDKAAPPTTSRKRPKTSRPHNTPKSTGASASRRGTRAGKTAPNRDPLEASFLPKQLAPGARLKRHGPSMYAIFRPPVALQSQMRFGSQFTSLFHVRPKEAGGLQIWLMGEMNLRFHTPKRWVFGLRGMIGQGMQVVDGKGVPGQLGFLVEPLFGIQWQSQVRHEVHYLITPRDGSKRFHAFTRFHTYRTHILGIRPYIGHLDRWMGGAHLSWDYISFNERDQDIEDIDAPANPQKRRIFAFELQARSTFRLGYLHPLGVGGGWEGVLTFGMVHLSISLSLYVGQHAHFIFSPTAGFLFQ